LEGERMDEGRVPPRCPSCGAAMRVVRIECPVCGTEVNGDFELCPACRLDDEHRRIFDAFLRARGNVRAVQGELGVSYPTARQRIEKMFRALEEGPPRPDPGVVLKKLDSGEIDVDTAEALLAGREED